MLELRDDFDGQTVICTFEVTPGSAQDVLDLLTRAYDEVISDSPGYLGGRCISTMRRPESAPIRNGAAGTIIRRCCARPRCARATASSMIAFAASSR